MEIAVNAQKILRSAVQEGVYTAMIKNDPLIVINPDMDELVENYVEEIVESINEIANVKC